MKQRSSSGLFLLELLLSILLFAASSAVCVRLFVESYLVSEKSDNLSHAVHISESLAACLQSSGNPEELSQYFPQILPFSDQTGASAWTLYYSEDWESLTDESEAAFQAILTLPGSEDNGNFPGTSAGPQSANIEILDMNATETDNQTLYSLSFAFDSEKQDVTQ